MKVTIKGQPYNLTRNAHGWGVTAMSKRTDRFWRNYQVYCGKDGKPLRCTCPHCVEKGAWCKHLKEVERIQQAEKDLREIEQQAEAVNMSENGRPAELVEQMCSSDGTVIAEKDEHGRWRDVEPANQLVEKPKPAAVLTRHYLRRDGWTITFEVWVDEVTIIQSYRGRPAGEDRYSVADARKVYKAFRDRGYQKVEGDL